MKEQQEIVNYCNKLVLLIIDIVNTLSNVILIYLNSVIRIETCIFLNIII